MSAQVGGCEERTGAHLWLAELLCSLREVENVINNLEGQTQVPAVLKHALLDLLAHTTEDCGRLAAGSNQRGRLVEGFVGVLLQGQAGVKEAPDLTDLAVCEVRNHLTDQLDDL